MATTHHPIPVPGLDPEPTFALHLDCGVWRASCPNCGYEVASGKRQEQVERSAQGRTCPICCDFRGGTAA
jgi:hypothetical protein